ncbi:MS4A4C protein [Apodemus speciosus]|uniref:MS4A4C protein n=1 Tax=Apodemus speciosus TaxID=105296 RepID=A0ABQ0FSJ3_APOSI
MCPVPAALETMQGLELTTMAVVPGGAQPSEKSVMKSQTWNENKEKFLKGEPKVLGCCTSYDCSHKSQLRNNNIDKHIFGTSHFSALTGPNLGTNNVHCLRIPVNCSRSGNYKRPGHQQSKLNIISSVLAAMASIICVVSLVVGSYSPFRHNNTITRKTV